VRVPDALIDAMRGGPCIDLQLDDSERVALLLEDYDFFVKEPEAFCERLEALTELRGKAVVSAWTTKVREGRTPEVVLDLLAGHYDPMYAQSMPRNFAQFAQAHPLRLRNRSCEALAEAAQALIASERAIT
jgi:tRNA 2-selenouridine synthase